ncbi:MAG: hypothetical protein ACREJD_04700 [Phycisphaerales bacterium]
MLRRALLYVAFVVCPLARAQIIADSVADYSGIQGNHNWYYGFSTYTNGTLGAFQQMTLFTGDVWHRAEGGGVSYWTSIWKDGQHPNAKVSTGGRLGEENWVIRRWVAPPGFLGYVHLSGRVGKQVTTGGDGSVFHIFVNSATAINLFLASNDLEQHTFAADWCVGAGDRIDFVVDPNINDQYDATNVTATISGPISSQPASASACPGQWATFTTAFYAASPSLVWEYEYTPGTWRAFNGNRQPLSCGGTIRSDVPLRAPTARVLVTGCSGTPAVNIRCRLLTCTSLATDTVTLSFCGADLNCDGLVDDADFQIFVNAYDALVCPGLPANCPADLNGDGGVDDGDFVRFIGAYNELVCP